MPPRQVLIAVIGTGGVGKAFLSQLATLSTRLAAAPTPTALSLIYLSRSTSALQSPDYTPLALPADLSNAPAPLALSDLAAWLAAAPAPAVLVDNTASNVVAESYPTFLSKGVNVVTPNKKAFSGAEDLWERIVAAASSVGGGQVLHESSVGAGLPILSTLTELVGTGDKVKKIEGVFSGTMSYLFNQWNPVSGEAGPSFSACVSKARNLGYTEPDPRDDLNGLDVARKCTILARLAGLKVRDAEAFPTQSLVPKELEGAESAEAYLEGMKKFDGEMETLKNDAAKEGKVLRFVGSVDVVGGQVKVGLEKFEKSHPIAALKGSDNIISFYTERYGDNPLIIQGAGAGGDVTAMGVTGDLLKIIKTLH
ncbi:homoserine dehydrogenase-like protein [Microthyrium microscopicum]|uniref:Homoserine dehydrogenase n=1 Tax=Microthyrium microscopicum TaxID=703497 RepID=A0A6A6TYS4_9PEZI|nr:homoserine dehydrogenase-like protein [Microthyrium microscopicum]